MMTRRLTYAALLLTAACGSTSPTPPTYTVSYQVFGSPSLRCDSVKYENAQGVIVKVVHPGIYWSVAYEVPTGSYLWASAWIVATASGDTAKLKATWTIPGVSTASDSSFGAPTAPGAFALEVSRRQL